MKALRENWMDLIALMVILIFLGFFVYGIISCSEKRSIEQKGNIIQDVIPTAIVCVAGHQAYLLPGNTYLYKLVDGDVATCKSKTSGLIKK